MSTTHSKSTGKVKMFKHIYFVLYTIEQGAQYEVGLYQKSLCFHFLRLFWSMSPMEMLRGLGSMQVPCFLLSTFNIQQGCIFTFLSGS